MLSQNQLTAEKIIKTLESRKDEIRKYGVKKIGLFGSYAKKTARKRSDIDFLVSFNKTSLSPKHIYHFFTYYQHAETGTCRETA